MPGGGAGAGNPSSATNMQGGLQQPGMQMTDQTLMDMCTARCMQAENPAGQWNTQQGGSPPPGGANMQPGRNVGGQDGGGIPEPDTSAEPNESSNK